MPQALSIQTIIEANRLASDVPFVCAIDVEVVNPDTGVVVTVLNFVNNSEPIVFQGVEYAPAHFDIKITAKGGTLSDVSLEFTDFTQTISAYMEAYGGGIGFNVTFYLLNAARLDLEPEIQEFFQIISAQSSNFVHTFKLGAENILTVTFPRRRQTRDFCQWTYKGPDCKYAGPLPSCDLSLSGPNGCAAHVNTYNFGAFPGINTNGLRYA